MNGLQKAYDSYDKNTKLLKLTNSYYHFRNLELIKNRKPIYSVPKINKNMHKRNYIEPYADYYVIVENDGFSQKLEKIEQKKITAKLNKDFDEKTQKIKDSRSRYKFLSDNLINMQNEDYKKRIKMQKAFIKAKKMDEVYNIQHPKMLTKLNQIGKESIVLPPIKNATVNPIIGETSKYYNTCGNNASSNDSKIKDYQATEHNNANAENNSAPKKEESKEEV